MATVHVRISKTVCEKIDALAPGVAKKLGLHSMTREQAVGILLEEAMKNYDLPAETPAAPAV